MYIHEENEKQARNERVMMNLKRESFSVMSMTHKHYE
jgi:hypothetical protein